MLEIFVSIFMREIGLQFSCSVFVWFGISVNLVSQNELGSISSAIFWKRLTNWYKLFFKCLSHYYFKYLFYSNFSFFSYYYSTGMHVSYIFWNYLLKIYCIFCSFFFSPWHFYVWNFFGNIFNLCFPWPSQVYLWTYKRDPFFINNVFYFSHFFLICFLKFYVCAYIQFSSVTQLCPTLRPHGLQHARLPCPPSTPGSLLTE